MQNLGSAIRKIRNQKKITLNDLAEKTSLSASFISKVERDINSPSFNSLQKICLALGVSSSDMIACEQTEEAEEIVFRKADRKLIYNYSNVVRYEAVFSLDNHLVVDVMTISGSRNEYSSTQHPNDEFGIVVRGVLSVAIEGTEHVLNEGDCILIRAGVIHRVQKCSEEECVSYWINIKCKVPSN